MASDNTERNYLAKIAKGLGGFVLFSLIGVVLLYWGTELAYDEYQVNGIRLHKLMWRFKVTEAAVHDSQVVDSILDPNNTASNVWADNAYQSAEIEVKLDVRSLKSRIHRKGHRNKHRSEVRARVEHIFGSQ